MTGPVFVDTNVLVYERDSSEPRKQPRANAWVRYLWETRTGRLSYQVLQELYVTVVNKLDPGLPASEARRLVRDLVNWRPVQIDLRVLEGAWQAHDRYALSWWDALIVAAAQATDCRVLLTEDLQHGQRFDRVEVVNPFESPSESPEEILSI